ncbi:MAG: putative Zn-dependent peptidase [Halieaceae bacterium]|jgi:predicted Zn-dependent peptidase
MKKILLFMFSLAITTVTLAQVDRTKAPTAGPAPKIQLGDYETFTLNNGLQVFLVENHKTPRVSWQLFINRNEVLDGDHAGMQSMMGSALMTGTTTKTKAQIDESVDFIGASLSTSAFGAYASSLSKHKETTLALMSDVILNPTFPEDELTKMKKQTQSGLMANASDPAAMSSNVSSVMTYGKSHPYGEVETSETVESITAEMCKSFYSTYFKPNVSYLIIVGDISKKEAISLVETNLGSWVKGDVPAHSYDMPTIPKANQVDFVNKPGAVQSTISIVYPLDLKPGSTDAIATSVMNAILGNSGFMARLIQNIREDKAYTYGAYSSLSADALVGDFYAGAEVRNDVTDSAIIEFLYEMERLTVDAVNDEELQNVKNYLNGRFARSLERPQTVARFALNTARYNLPSDYYATYLENLQAVTAEDVMRVASKYLKPNNAHIVVVGNKEEVANKLKVFSADNKINYLDAFGNPVADVSPIPEGVTSQVVIDHYLMAMGGKEKLADISAQDVVMSSSMQGMPLEVRMVTKGSSKMLMTVKSGEMNLQSVIINGVLGKASGMMGSKDLTPEEVSTYLQDAVIFEELSWSATNTKLIHIEEIEGVSVYKMEVTNSDGSVINSFFDVKTGLKVSTIKTQETPKGPMISSSIYKDYKSENGIMYPATVVEDNAGQVMELKVVKIQFGGKVSDSIFNL